MTSDQLGLQRIDTFVIQRDVLIDTLTFLSSVGKQGFEGFVLWAGKKQGLNTVRLSSALIPEQKPSITTEGLLVEVTGDALFKVNKTVFERNEILAAQVHTHPTSAYHSSTDDHYPLVTLLGALSVVLPNFAQNAPSDIDEWAWYRLAGTGIWKSAAPNTEVVFE